MLLQIRQPMSSLSVSVYISCHPPQIMCPLFIPTVNLPPVYHQPVILPSYFHHRHIYFQALFFYYQGCCIFDKSVFMVSSLLRTISIYLHLPICLLVFLPIKIYHVHLSNVLTDHLKISAHIKFGCCRTIK